MIDGSSFQMLLLTVTSWLDQRVREVLAYLIEENRVLRRQVGGRRLRLTADDRRKLAARAYRLDREALRDVATIVTSDTLLRWHRQLIARKWTYANHGPTRRGVVEEIRELIRRMAEENRSWGCTRIQGGLKNSGAASAVQRLHGSCEPPAFRPRRNGRPRGRRSCGRTGVRSPAQISSRPKVWTWHGLVRFYTVLVIDLGSRRIQVLGSTPHPDETFMSQIVRNLALTDPMGVAS